MRYIVDDIGLVVDAMKAQAVKPWDETPNTPNPETPYYMYGHRLEINNNLLEKNDDGELKYKKYPLVALRIDVDRDYRTGNFYHILNVAILASTEKGYHSDERHEQVFKPVLYPLYRSFMHHLRSVGLFSWEGFQDFPPHKPIDRFYYGTSTEEQNVKNFFSDPLDCIELIDLKISQRIKIC